MANYTLTHTGAQVDDAVEKVVNPYENVTLTVNSGRLANFSYTARYYPMLGMTFVRIYGTINTTMNQGYDYNVINIGSRVPNANVALAARCNKGVVAQARTSNMIDLRPLEDGVNGYDVYITGWWYV